MGKCEYLNCKNLTRRVKKTKGSDLSFFRFPNEIDLCKKWIAVCQSDSLYDIGVENLHKSHVICGMHFKDFDFVNPLTKKKLRKGAVPSQLSISTVPKSNVISSFGHYVVTNRHEKHPEYESNFDQGLTFSKEKPKCKKKLRKLELVKDLACLEKLANISQNFDSLIPPISPPSVHSSHDCTFPNEESRNCTAIHQSRIPCTISAHSVSTSELLNKSFVFLKPIPPNITINKPQPEKTKIDCSGTLSCEHIELSDNEKCYKLNDCLENPRNLFAVDATTVILDKQNLNEFSFKGLYAKVVNLSLANNSISELRWFVNLPNLRNLNLSKNNLSNVMDLSLLGHVANIDLSNNFIQSLEEFVPVPTKTYENLRSLNLSGNKIAKIINLSALRHLEKLNLADNYMKSLKNFGSDLPKSLSKISLENNYITDMNDFSELTALQNLKNISVHNNPCFSSKVLVLDGNKSISSLQHIDFIPFLIVRFPRVALINGKAITTEERNIARMLITEGNILSPEFNDDNLLLSCLAKYCMKSEDEIIKTEKLAESEECYPVRLLTQNTEITYERDNYECFSASCSRNKSAIEEKSRQNYIELIEEKARSYKLTREVEVLSDKIQYLETILSRNGLNMEDTAFKIE